MMTGRTIHHHYFFTGSDKIMNKQMDNFTQTSKPITEPSLLGLAQEAVNYPCQRISDIHVEKTDVVLKVSRMVLLGLDSLAYSGFNPVFSLGDTAFTQTLKTIPKTRTT